jgi:Skp family chaperone for outer membrane proteins
MLKIKTVYLILALAVLAAAFGSAFAAAVPQAAPVFGSVNLDKVLSSYDKKQTYDQQLQAYQAQLEQRLELRGTNKLLTTEEFNQLADLIAKANPADTDKNKIEELQNLAKQRDQEYQSLQQKPNATDAEKAQLKDLQAKIDKAAAEFDDSKAKSESDLSKKYNELSEQLTKEVEAAVAAVAKEKNLAMVFSKSLGRTELVVYSSNDITDDVIKKLNKK